MKNFSFLNILSLFLILTSFKMNAQCISQVEFESLIDIYNSTNGDNWVNNTGWDINASACDVSNDWYGLTIENGHVTSIQLQNNNLNGTIPNSITRLTYLRVLYLYLNQLSGSFPSENINDLSSLTNLSIRNNQLNDLPDLTGISGLELLRIENNAFTFEDIVPNTGIASLSTFTYSPQAKIGEEQSQFVEFGLDFTISVSVNGTNNTYQWYKDGVIINGATNTSHLIESFTNEEAGVYYCEIKNAQAGLLTLQSEDITLVDRECSSGVSQQEFYALVALYNSTAGDNWVNNTGWDINATACDVSNDWYGLTIENGHVTSIQLQNNNLNGTIPNSITRLTYLRVLYLYLNQLSGSFPSENINDLSSLTNLSIRNNQLNDLPDLTGISGLELLRIENNAFTFEDIVPNTGIASLSTFTYSPQAYIGEEINHNVPTGNDFNISINIGGTDNTYLWYKDGVVIPGANEASYAFTNFSETDIAVYYCEIKNTQAPALTLLSNNFNLDILIGLVTINAVSITDGTTCSISGVVPEIEFPSNNTFSFVPETTPGTASLQINTTLSGIKRIRFDIDNNYTITNVLIEVDGTYIPLSNEFFSITRIEENLHSILQLEQIENICVYYPNK